MMVECNTAHPCSLSRSHPDKDSLWHRRGGTRSELVGEVAL